MLFCPTCGNMLLIEGGVSESGGLPSFRTLTCFFAVTHVLATALAHLPAGGDQVLLHDVPVHPACDHQGEGALASVRLAKALRLALRPSLRS